MRALFKSVELELVVKELINNTTDGKFVGKISHTMNHKKMLWM